MLSNPKSHIDLEMEVEGYGSEECRLPHVIPSPEVPVAAALVLFEAELSYKIGIAFMLKVN